MKKVLKPRFILTRVYDDGSRDEPRIAPLAQAVGESKMNRRGFLGAGLTASAALALLDSCSVARWNVRSSPRQEDRECGKTYAHSDDVVHLSISGNGQMLASGSKDGTVKCWNVQDQALVQTFRYSGAAGSLQMALNHTGTAIAFGVSGQSCDLRSLPDGKLIKNFSGSHFGFDAGRDRLIVANSKRIEFHSFPKGGVRSVNTDYSIESMAVSPDGQRIAIAAVQKGILLLNDEAKEIKTLYGDDGSSITSLVFAPDGQSLAFARKKTDGGAEMMILGIPEGEKRLEAENGSGHPAFSSDGEWLFWENPRITALNTGSHERKSLPLPDSELSIVYVPDDRFIVTGGKNGSLKLWNWPDTAFFRCFMDIQCSGSRSRGSIFNYTDQWGRILSYTLPCDSPLPAGATCTCNCVPGKMESVCTCNQVCTCNKVCTCNTVCTCQAVGRSSYCTCNMVCTCLAVYR
ncbi:MAG: hypothetical protein LBJ23_07440 [Tannerella sp.]|jgi:WD40 repeat protein|nr:hypothetical protein [Tannerella sp.]